MTQKPQKLSHPHFSQWYKTVDLEGDSNRIQNRLKGTTQLTESAERQDIEALLRCIYRIKGTVQPDKMPYIREIYQKIDTTFGEDKNDREMEILCGATLALLCEKSDELATTAALSILAANVEGGRTYDLPMKLTELAYSCLGRVAEDKRQRPDLSNMRINSYKLDLTSAKTKLQSAVDVTTLPTALDEIAREMQKCLGASVADSYKAFQAVSDFAKVQDEELQMLWWIFGSRSLERKKPFKDLQREEAPLVLGKELADNTVIQPGRPNSIENLLAKAGLDEIKFSIPTAVNGCDLVWLQKLEIPVGHPLSAPISYAIQRRLETGDTQGWITGWSATTGISESHEMSRLSMGLLFYYESLLTKFMDD
jgi:hypothetical protein